MGIIEMQGLNSVIFLFCYFLIYIYVYNKFLFSLKKVINNSAKAVVRSDVFSTLRTLHIPAI